MTEKNEIKELQKKEYALRQKIERLQQRMFLNKDSSSTNKTLFMSLKEELSNIIEKLSIVKSVPENYAITLGQQAKGITSNEKTRSLHFSDDAPQLDIENIYIMTHIPTAIYHLFDKEEYALIDFEINLKTPSKKQLRIESYIEGYSARAIDTISVKKNNKVNVFQQPTLFPHLIENIKEITKATLHVSIKDLDKDKIIVESSMQISLLSRNSIMWGYYNLKQRKEIDIHDYIVTFVTPNQSEVISFLRHVANIHPQKILLGYQGKSDEETKQNVRVQVQTIFEALKEHGIIYVNSVIDFRPLTYGGQRVRLPKEVLQEKQANCFDGTLLFASLLEACSLNPQIILSPTHAFVGWETLEGSDDWEYVETTVIGYKSFEEACEEADDYAIDYRDELQYFNVTELRYDGIMPME